MPALGSAQCQQVPHGDKSTTPPGVLLLEKACLRLRIQPKQLLQPATPRRWRVKEIQLHLLLKALPTGEMGPCKSNSTSRRHFKHHSYKIRCRLLLSWYPPSPGEGTAGSNGANAVPAHSSNVIRHGFSALPCLLAKLPSSTTCRHPSCSSAHPVSFEGCSSPEVCRSLWQVKSAPEAGICKARGCATTLVRQACTLKNGEKLSSWQQQYPSPHPQSTRRHALPMTSLEAGTGAQQLQLASQWGRVLVPGSYHGCV